MKRYVMKTWGLVLTWAFLLSAVPGALATGGSQLRLSVKPSKVKVGQDVVVALLVKQAPEVYGADIHMTFDPALLEVVDTDQNSPGVQFEPGDFIDPSKSFSLQYAVDNTAGTIDYALTLLNPAPAVQGDGQLARVTFRTKAEGQTSVSITEGTFGTRNGGTIVPDLDSTAVRILPPQPVRDNKRVDSWIKIASLSLGGILIIGMVSSWLWHHRAKQR